MNDTPTPQTDAAWDKYVTPPYPLCAQDVAELCRKLERERDELAESILNLSHPNCQILLRERDEAWEQRDGLATALSDVMNSQDSTSMYRVAKQALATLNQPEP